MKCFTYLLFATALVVCLTVAAPQSYARVGVTVRVGPEPVCPYGYYYDPPYRCAPYGYYGPEWFSDGVFIGAGPWWHGERHWRGHVNHRYGRRYYRGNWPRRGEHADWERHRFDDFHGSRMVDGYGHRVR